MNHLLFLNIGAGEIMVIALFVLLFFGSKQIPDIMRGLGRATREFKDAMNGIEREVRTSVALEEEKAKEEEKKLVEEKKVIADSQEKVVRSSETNDQRPTTNDQ